MADIAVISLELSTSKLAQQARQAEDSLNRVKNAGDRVEASQRKTARSTSEIEREFQRSAREAFAYAQATSRLQRALGDYGGAVTTLKGQLKDLSATSAQYVRVQAQIAQIQAQSGRAQRGENFAGFASSLKGIQGEIGKLQGLGAALSNIPGLSGAGGLATRLGGVATAIEGVSASASPALVAVGALGAGMVALGAGAVYGSKQLIDFALAGAKAADDLSDLASILGVQPAFLQKLGVAYSLAGKNVGDAQAAITKFEAGLGQAAAGNAPQLASALKAIGLNAKTAGDDVQGSFTKVLDVLGRSTDQTKVAAVATELFGRKGLELVRIYKDLSDSSSDLNQQLSRYGLLVGGDVLSKAAKLADAQDLIKKRMETLSIIVAAKLSPVLVKFTDDFLTAFLKAEPAIVSVTGALGGVLGGLGSIAKFLSDHPILARVLAGPALTGLTGGQFGPLGLSSGTSTPTTAVSHGGSPFKVGPLSSDLRSAFSGSAPPPDPLDAFLKAINTKTGGGGRGSRETKLFEFKDSDGLTAFTQGLKDTIEAAARLGRQGLPDLDKSIIEATFDIDTLSKVLAVLPPTSREYAQTATQLNKALVELNVAEQKRLDLLTATRLPTRLVGQLNTEDVFRNLPLQSIPGRAISSKTFEDFFAPHERRRPGELIGLGERLGGRNDPLTGERIRGAGEDITQEFLTGLLMGRPDVVRAGENVAFFFADHFARQLTDALREALKPALDVLGDAIGGLFKSIFSKVAGGALGGIFGGLFRAGGGPVSAGMGYTVGESGREWFVPQQNGWIVNQQQAAAAVGGGGGRAPIQVVNNFNISAPAGRVDSRSTDQIADSVYQAVARAQRNKGA